jgi:hypothetical protein
VHAACQIADVKHLLSSEKSVSCYTVNSDSPASVRATALDLNVSKEFVSAFVCLALECGSGRVQASPMAGSVEGGGAAAEAGTPIPPWAGAMETPASQYGDTRWLTISPSV